jgi:hypothetical protein
LNRLSSVRYDYAAKQHTALTAFWQQRVAQA